MLVDIPIFDLNELPTEAECISILKDIQQEKFVCKQCQSTDSRWKSDRRMLECKKCLTRISITTNTIMERTRIPLRTWVYILQYRCLDKSISINDLQYKSGLSRYDTIHSLCVKIDTQLRRQELDFSEEITLAFLMKLDNSKSSVILELTQMYISWLSSAPFSLYHRR